MRSIIHSLTPTPRNSVRWAATLLFGASLPALGYAQESKNASTKDLLPDVTRNAVDEPRATPVTREVMKQYLEDLKQRTPRIPLPEMTEEEKKAALEDPRAGTYEGRLRKLYLPESPTSNYLPFSGASRQSASRMGPPEPLLSLDYAFKVRLFWIAARANNCQYCLGHQESKLLAAGMSEDDIAALDSQWELFPENEQAAFALAKRLTLEPHLISDEDIDRCRPFYNDAQIIEMIGSVAGNNAINRWKEGAGIPQSTNGGGFGSRDSAPGSASAATEEHSYLTATSDQFASRRSKIVSLDPSDASLVQITRTKFQREPLESKDFWAAKLQEVPNRTPRLPLVDADRAAEVMGDAIKDGRVEQWHRLLAHFPIAGKRFADGMRSAATSDQLSPTLQTQIDWVVARQDRAWYAAALALDSMKGRGMSETQIESLDQNLGSAIPDMQDRDRALLNVAQKLCASPIVLTDKEVADAVKLAGPKAVTQTINYAAYRAAFNRITEAAGLGK